MDNKILYLKGKDLKLLCDYYIFLRCQKLSASSYDITKNSFKKVLPNKIIQLESDLFKKPFLIVASFFYLNLFNFSGFLQLSAVHKNMSTKEIFKEMFGLNSINKNFTAENFFNFYSQTLKTFFLKSFSPTIFFNKSAIYMLSYYHFFFKYNSHQKMLPTDYLQLFLSSFVGTIPFNLFIMKNYLKEINPQKSIPALSLIKKTSLLSFSENFLTVWIFFSSIKFFNNHYGQSKKTLDELEGYFLYKETIQKNPTLSLVFSLNPKNSFMKKDDSLSILLMSSLFVTLIYTPINMLVNFYIINKPIKQQIESLIKTTKLGAELRTQTLVTFKNLLLINWFRFFFQYGVVYSYLYLNCEDNL